jgi:hypothetical protein
MKKSFLVFFLFLPIFLFAGVFEHLLNQDIQYLFKHQFRCLNGICISPEKNVYDNEIMDKSIKVIKAFLDHEEKVFKLEIELNIYEEEKDAFYESMLKLADKSGHIVYDLKTLNDKYGNHSIIYLTDKIRKKNYTTYLSDKYYRIMKKYKPEQ